MKPRVEALWTSDSSCDKLNCSTFSVITSYSICLHGIKKLNFFNFNMGGWATNLLHNKYSLRQRKERKNLLIGWCFSSTHTHDTTRLPRCDLLNSMHRNFNTRMYFFYHLTKYFLTDCFFFVPLSCRQSYVWLLVMIMAAANDEDDDFVGGIIEHTQRLAREKICVVCW